MSGRGTTVIFHGAYSKKSAAKAKAKSREGKVIMRRIAGDVRYVVVTPR